MNNDLISREALKNMILDYRPDDIQQSDIDFDTCDIKIWLSVVLKIIDNAPTVFDNKAYSDGYTQGTCDCEHAHERPQGEWITRHKLNSFGQDVVCFECNKCGEYKVPLYHLFITEPLKVCPNCGADMRKGGAE